MKHWGYIALVLCILSLAACRTMQAVQEDLNSIPGDLQTHSSINADPSLRLLGSCPKVEIVEDLAVFSDFAPPAAMDADNMVSSVGMTRTATSCNDNKRSVTVDIGLAFDAVLGPRGRVSSNDKPFFTYPYFVAVTDPSGRIMAKEIFAASLSFEPGQDTHTHQETLRHIIPLDNPANVSNYRVLIGFQLSQEQLAFNRAAIAQAKAQAKAAKEAAAKAAPAAMQEMPAVPVSDAGAPINLTDPQ